MDALHPRAVDENFAKRPRQGQELDIAARQLHREIRLRRAVGEPLEIIRTYRVLDEAEEAAQNPILVEAFDLVELLRDFLDLPQRLDGGPIGVFRIEPRLEQGNEPCCDRRMP